MKSTGAPWAEVVPGVGPTRVEDLLTMADDGWRYEVVEGVLVRLAGSTFEVTTVAGLILAALLGYVRPGHWGAITGADAVYRASFAETALTPQVGFVRAARMPRIDKQYYIPFAPDLAVEVASATQTEPAMAAKARVYLAGGTRLVWIVWPDMRTVDIWRGRARFVPTARLGMDDVFDGEDVVPGFTYPVAAIFA